MLDLKLLREKPDWVAEKLSLRGYVLPIEDLKKLEAERKTLQTETQDLQNIRNTHSREIGIAKGKGMPVEHLLEKMHSIGEELKDKEAALEVVQSSLQRIYELIPNIPHESVPIGKDEQQNQEVRRWGELPKFSFTPKDHIALGGGNMDFEAATRISGARFVVLKSGLARLHRALAQFMIDLHTRDHGYQEVYVPYLVKTESLYGTGQYPKLADDQFKIQDSDLWLIPTSEVAVTNLVRDQILSDEALPLKHACYSPCFRSEAGSYGKDMKGMIRQHQFDKVEMVQIVKPETSYAALEEMLKHAETVLQKLKLPYRVVSLCTGDLGFSSAKTYDLEVYLPGQTRYREISSCSNTESFQARRLQARFRDPATNRTEFVHTLNGSGVAVGRALIAVMENYQDEAGRIHVPEVLLPYMGGMSVI